LGYYWQAIQPLQKSSKTPSLIYNNSKQPSIKFPRTKKTLYQATDNLRLYTEISPPPEKIQASQFMAMLATTLGMYQEAENHHHAAFPASKSPGDCPTSGAATQSAFSAIEKIAENEPIVMINESHSIIATRAFILQILPIFKKSGFKYLALEALAPTPDNNSQNHPVKSLEDEDLPVRGYPLDNSSAGFYLREPIYAELLRAAITSGFKLIAYEELNTSSREQRETGQARTLAKLIAHDPEAKLLVIAGYAHIWKNDGWMADRLQKETGRNVFSIDQTSRMSGCKEKIDMDSSSPFILMTDNGMWASDPQRVDATIVHPPRNGNVRTMTSGWLTLGGHRKAIQPDTDACTDGWPCLISAIHENENELAVPADRVLLKNKNDDSMLFLKPGTYRYILETRNGTKITQHLKVY